MAENADAERKAKAERAKKLVRTACSQPKLAEERPTPSPRCGCDCGVEGRIVCPQRPHMRQGHRRLGPRHCYHVGGCRGRGIYRIHMLMVARTTTKGQEGRRGCCFGNRHACLPRYGGGHASGQSASQPESQ